MTKSQKNLDTLFEGFNADEYFAKNNKNNLEMDWGKPQGQERCLQMKSKEELLTHIETLLEKTDKRISNNAHDLRNQLNKNVDDLDTKNILKVLHKNNSELYVNKALDSYKVKINYCDATEQIIKMLQNQVTSLYWTIHDRYANDLDLEYIEKYSKGAALNYNNYDSERVTDIITEIQVGKDLINYITE